MVETTYILNHYAFEQAVEFLFINTIRPLDLAIEARGPRPDVDVVDALIFEMSVELGVELTAVVRLYRLHPKGQP